MANIGNLALMLSVNPSEFTSGLEKAQAKLKDFATQAKSILGSVSLLGGALGGLGGFLSVSGIGEAMGQSLDRIAETAKGADKFGISMKDMAGFQTLAGDKAEQFTHALGKLNAELGKLKAGSAEAATKFQDLGFSADQFKGKDLADSYRIIADRLKAFPDAAQRALAAQELLGKSGVDFVGTLNKGAAALDNASKKAEEMGRVLDREAAQKAIDAKKAMEELKQSIGAMAETAAVKGAPALTVLTKNLDDIVKHPAAHMWKSFTDVMDAISHPMQSRQEGIAAKNLFQTSGGDFGDMVKGADLSGFAQAFKKAKEALDMESEGLGLSTHQHELLKLETIATTDAQRKMIDGLKEKAAALDENIQMLKDQKFFEEAAGKEMDSNRTVLEKFREEMEGLAMLQRGGFLPKEEQLKSSKRLIEGLRDSMGLDNAPGIVTGQEAGSAAAQQTLAQAEARNSFAWADDLKSLLEVANQINEENGRKMQEWIDQNQKVISAAF